MKKVGILIVFLMVFSILIIKNLSAIVRLNEIESNPAGTDAGNEWIEFYSSESENIDLSEYHLLNHAGKVTNLSGIFSGYYVYVFPKQFIVNEEENLKLYKGDNLVYETEVLSDMKNDDFSWQYCSGSEEKWQFLESTKEEKNNCKGEISAEAETVEDIENLEDEKSNREDDTESDNDNGFNENTSPITSRIVDGNLNVIKLDSNKLEDSEEGINYVIYGLGLFCILLGVLYFLRKKRIYKSEFIENNTEKKER